MKHKKFDSLVLTGVLCTALCVGANMASANRIQNTDGG